MQNLQISLELEADSWQLICTALQTVGESALGQGMLRQTVFLHLCRQSGYHEQYARIFSDIKVEIELGLAGKKGKIIIPLLNSQVSIILLVISSVYQFFLVEIEMQSEQSEAGDIADCLESAQQFDLLLQTLLDQIELSPRANC